MTWLSLGVSQALAQPAPAAAAGGAKLNGPDPRTSYDFGVHVGPLLPHKVPGITEVVNGWGLRAAVPTPKGVFEPEFYFGRSDGVKYNSASLDYRLDIINEFLPVHFLVGMHFDTYTPANGVDRYAGGWHYGGGTAMQMAGPMFFRFDFKQRFSPGDSVYVSVSLLYRLAEGGSTASP